MSHIKLSTDQTAHIVDLLQTYFKDKLDSEIGRFEAEFLLDFFNEEIGGIIYNQAIADAQQLLDAQLDSMSENLLNLQKWVP